MKKNVVILLFSLVFVILTTVHIRNTRQENKNEFESLSSQNESDYYIIKEYQGKIAIFEDDITTPYAIYDTYTSVLPETDRQKLKEGILVKDKDELQKVIEDYTS